MEAQSLSIYLSDILESFYCLTSKDDTVKIEKNQQQQQGGILRTCNWNRQGYLILKNQPWDLSQSETGKYFEWIINIIFSSHIIHSKCLVPPAPPLDLLLHSSSMRINASYLLNAPSWTPKIDYRLPVHLLDHLRYISSGGRGGFLI